jgi:hypothetical protein
MEAVCTSETSVYFNETTRRSVTEGCHLRTHCRDKTKPHTLQLSLSVYLSVHCIHSSCASRDCCETKNTLPVANNSSSAALKLRVGFDLHIPSPHISLLCFSYPVPDVLYVQIFLYILSPSLSRSSFPSCSNHLAIKHIFGHSAFLHTFYVTKPNNSEYE